METFASVVDESPSDKTLYESSAKAMTPDGYDVEAQESSTDFFKRSNAEYYTAT